MPDYPKLGPTGEFPFGKPIDENDRGGLYVAFKVHKEIRRCSWDFGTTLWHISGPIPEMRHNSRVMVEAIHKAWGKLPYNKAELPMNVRIIHGNIVQVHLPQPTSILVANPEVFLALAEVIEDRIKKVRK